ncbi:MAG: hypothetical protein IKS37_02225 [Solobacterium sp.]|nr:hypothetical protein [Solobacterium sp.]
MKYIKEYKLECIRKRQAGEYIELPPEFKKRRSFMNNRTGEYETIAEILPDLSDYHEFFVN